MAINPGENFERFPQNYQSYSFAAWYTAPSDHESMETLLDWERATPRRRPLPRYVSFSERTVAVYGVLSLLEAL